MLGNNFEMLSIKVGQAKMANLALLFQVRLMFERVEVSIIIEVPPLELQDFQCFNIHMAQGNGNIVLYYLPGHRSGPGDPLRQ